MSKVLALDTEFKAASQMPMWHNAALCFIINKVALFKIVVFCSSWIWEALIFTLKNTELNYSLDYLVFAFPPALYQTILSFFCLILH